MSQNKIINFASALFIWIYKKNKKRAGNQTLDAFCNAIFLRNKMYHMKYFTIKKSFFSTSYKYDEVFNKINKFLVILEKSNAYINFKLLIVLLEIIYL